MEKRKILKVLCWNFLCLLLFSSLAFGETVTVSIPDTSGTPGEYVKVPVQVASILPESMVTSAEFNLTFNSNLLQVDSVIFEGSLIPESWFKAIYSPDSSSFVNIALAGDTTRISGSGTLAYVWFKVSSSALPGDSSILDLTKVMLNEWVPSVIDDGVLRVVPTAVYEDHNLNLPSDFSLGQNYPNPFNPATTIPFRVESGPWSVVSPIRTTLNIYNILGQKIRDLVDEKLLPGGYQVIWDSRDDRGKEVPSGVYFYQLKSGNTSETRKMVLMR
jgi:hypothetical protein